MNKLDPLRERELKRMPATLEKVRLDGTFSGYASIFNEVDEGRDVVAPGAFRNSLKGNLPGSIRMLFQHNPDEPIGVWTKIVEDEKGLYVEGRITTGVRRSDEILALMREGAIDGLSIGFRTRRARTNPTTRVRRILAADLWEISVVTFPLLASARISSVKSASGSKRPTIREFERWLTRDAGLTRSEALTVIAKGYREFASQREAARHEPLQMKIRQATQTLLARN